MKYLKLLGLASIAAMALMAFGGVSASADVLCKVAVNEAGECPTTNDYNTNTEFKALSTNAKLTVTGSTVGVTSLTCTESNTTLVNTGTGSNTSGEGVPGEVKRLQFGGTCKTNNGFTCTVAETSGYKGTLAAKNDAGTGELTATGKGIKTLVSCAAGLFKCEYEAPEAGVKLHFNPGLEASVEASEQKLVTVAGGSGCGTESKWDATYKLTTNKALWVATRNA